MSRPIIPKTPEGVPLASIRGKRLYGLRPGYGTKLNECPYCGRNNPIHGGESGSVGFRIAAWSKHLYACFERALLRHGWIEGTYVEKYMLHPLIRPDAETIKLYCKRLRLPQRDVVIKETA